MVELNVFEALNFIAVGNRSTRFFVKGLGSLVAHEWRAALFQSIA